MEKSKAIKEVELTLESLDTIELAKAPDGFLNSISRKIIFLEEKEEIRWFNRAKVALAAMVALAIINAALLLGNTTDDRSDYIDSVATEWNLGPIDY